MLTSFKLLNLPELIHFQTKRIGGVSSGPYYSLNTSFAVGDSYANVMKNRQFVANEIGIDLSRFVFCRQIHSDGVHCVCQSDIGRGVDLQQHDIIQDTDAMITNIPQVVLCIKTADCLPLFLYAPDKKVVGIAHIGWKGALAQLPLKTIQRMQEEYDVDVTTILAVIGVGCGECCYEISMELAGKFPTDFIMKQADGKIYLNLKEFVKNQILMSGLSDSQIEVSSMCSICNSDIYFSSRAQQGIVGYGLAGISLL